MPTIFSKPELFRMAADALPPYCCTRGMILLCQTSMSLKNLWDVLASCLRYISHPESSFFKEHYEQIVGDAKLGSAEQKQRLDEFLEKIQTVMRDLNDAIRLESRQAPADSVYTKLMVQHQYTAPLPTETVKVDSLPPQLPKQASPSPPPKQATPPPQPPKQATPPPQPQKRKSESPPPEPKKQASPLLGELVALGIGSAPICQAFIDKPKVGFADQGVQCLADLGLLDCDDANAMLRLVGLNGIQISKVLKAVFKA